jgi:hypothetical protein
MMKKGDVVVDADDDEVRTVHYHAEGSKKLNACILLLAHMVYL